MSSGLVRVAIFAAALALIAGAAAAVGYGIGPIERGGDGMQEHGMQTAGPEEADGLAVAEGGMRLVAENTTLAAGRAQKLSFRIDGVEEFDVEHERRMHLIVVRRDLTGFQHLHPEQQPGGAWTATLGPLAPGSYRAFADFATAGEKHVLGVDLHVPGEHRELDLPSEPIELHASGLRAGRAETLEFHTDLDVGRYLGARGHLVVLRQGDLGYLHVHADSDDLHFETHFPSAGRYRGFLQVSVGGEVRTAAFDLDVAP